MNRKSIFKYFVHALAFFCIPLIIIRGVDAFFHITKTKNIPNEIKNQTGEKVFSPVFEARTKIIWWGQINSVQFLLSLHSSSIELNLFNDMAMNSLLKNSNYTYSFLYVYNLQKKSIHFDPLKINVSIFLKNVTYDNISHIKNNRSLYLSWLLNKRDIKTDNIRKCLIAFNSKANLLTISSVEFIWKKQKIQLKKIICLKEQLDEFIQKPTALFFAKNN